MATVKIASLAIKTLAKPIANQLKDQARNHRAFRDVCIGIAQFLHRNEVRMRINLLGEKSTKASKNVRPLNDTKAIDYGANFISESFLFLVATGLIVAETVRGRMASANRRDTVDDKLEQLKAEIESLKEEQKQILQTTDKQIADHTQSISQLAKVTNSVIDIGLGSYGEWRKRLATEKPSTTTTSVTDDTTSSSTSSSSLSSSSSSSTPTLSTSATR